MISRKAKTMCLLFWIVLTKKGREPISHSENILLYFIFQALQINDDRYPSIYYRRGYVSSLFVHVQQKKDVKSITRFRDWRRKSRMVQFHCILLFLICELGSFLPFLQRHQAGSVISIWVPAPRQDLLCICCFIAYWILYNIFLHPFCGWYLLLWDSTFASIIGLHLATWVL